MLVIVTVGPGLFRTGVIYDGWGNFQTFQRKPLVTPIGVIYNKVGVGNLGVEFFFYFNQCKANQNLYQ